MVAGHSYTWSVNNGTITGSSPINTVTINWNNIAGAGWVRVTETNTTTLCSFTTANYNVSVGSLAPGAPGAITGPATVCFGESGVNYSISAVTDATNYVWTVPAGVTLVSGQGTLGITVNFTALAASPASISVYAENGCGPGAAANRSVTITPTVGTPTVPTPSATTICQGSANTVYTTSATDATSYNWSVTGAGNTIAGTGTTGTVTWAAGYSGTATVSVTANGCNGPSGSSSTTVVVRPTPTATISGTTTVCINAGSPNITFTNPRALAETVTYDINGTVQPTVNVAGLSIVDSSSTDSSIRNI